jgi:hypothetical protein
MLRWILSLLGVDDAPDSAWAPTGIAVKFRGHDESKARTRWEQQEAEAAACREASLRAQATVARKGRAKATEFPREVPQ